MARPRRGEVPANHGVLPEDGLRIAACTHCMSVLTMLLAVSICLICASDSCAPCLRTPRFYKAISSPMSALEGLMSSVVGQSGSAVS